MVGGVVQRGPVDEERVLRWLQQWVLRLAFLALAEQRRMLPVGNRVYANSYSLSGLLRQLVRGKESGSAGLGRSRWAFARLESLCRLIHDGSAHPELPLCGYGSELFEVDCEAEWGVSDEAVCGLLVALGGMLDGGGGVAEGPGGEGVNSSEVLGELYQILAGLEVRWRDGRLEVASNQARRKQLGIYYTPAALVRPLVKRVLEPLVYPGGTLARPDAILSLTVLDPAVGSGTFLVEALRYISGALTESILAHSGVEPVGGEAGAWLARVGSGMFVELPCSPWRERGRRVLEMYVRRIVAERCLFGVDLDPAAVQVARLSLWLESFDASLPFSFLDHAVKCGNSLVGCQLSDAGLYPVEAARGRIALVSDGSLAAAMRGRLASQVSVLRRELQSPSLPGLGGPQSAYRLRRRLAEAVDNLHKMWDSTPEQKGQHYRKWFADNAEVRQLRHRMDSWCALWFWPVEELEEMPLPEDWGEPWRGAVERCREEVGFFHWELEFPSVFCGGGGGFDAVVGNPPWERLVGQGEVSGGGRALLHHGAKLHEAGGPLSGLYGRLTSGRAKPLVYRWQSGAGNNLYQFFLERGLRLLKREGRFGFIVPAGLGADEGARELRRALFREAGVEIMAGVENRGRVFDIDGRFGFMVVAGRRTGPSSGVELSFVSDDAPRQGDSEVRGSRMGIEGPVAGVATEALPCSGDGVPMIPERVEPQALALLQRLLSDGASMEAGGEGGFGVAYRRELDMTTSGAGFRGVWEMEGGRYVQDEVGVWRGDQGCAMPLVQGASFHGFSPWYQAWDGGADGRWRRAEAGSGPLRPKYLVPVQEGSPDGFKLVVRRVARTSDERTLIAAIVPSYPCGDKAPWLLVRDPVKMLGLCSLLNSLVADFVCRSIGSGTNVDWHRLRGIPVPRWESQEVRLWLPLLALALHPGHELYRPLWELMAVQHPWLRERRELLSWAVTDECQRRRVQSMVDALSARAYGLSSEDFDVVVRDCAHPTEALRNGRFTSSLAQTGFWRVDRHLPPEQRRPVMAAELLSSWRGVKGLDVRDMLERCGETGISQALAC